MLSIHRSVRGLLGLSVQRISQLKQNVLEEKAERACNQLLPNQPKRSE